MPLLPTVVNGNGQACGTYHWQTTWPAHNCSYPQGHESVHKCKALPSDWGKTPHEFAVEHTADYLAFVVDGQTIVNTSTTSPAKPLFWPMPFFLILNTAIGGEGTWASPPSSDTTFPTFHRIDCPPLSCCLPASALCSPQGLLGGWLVGGLARATGLMAG